MERPTVFLTIDQAREAVCTDLRQYPAQVPLMCEILRLLIGSAGVRRDPRRRAGAWVRVSGKGRLRWLEGGELTGHLCRLLRETATDTATLAGICARVFRTSARPAIDARGGAAGVRIATGMEDFRCRQCGRCCRELDYRRELRPADVRRWERLGRRDILAWVGGWSPGRRSGFRMWVTPGTNRPAQDCPFLHKIPTAARWICRIHEVKPKICREYPVSRKHALMTGCPGFAPSRKPAAK